MSAASTTTTTTTALPPDTYASPGENGHRGIVTQTRTPGAPARRRLVVTPTVGTQVAAGVQQGDTEN